MLMRKRQHTLSICIGSLLAACTGEIGWSPSPPGDPTPTEDYGATFVDQGLVDDTPEMPSQSSPDELGMSLVAAAPPRRTLFLNRAGGTYRPHTSSYGVDSRINQTWMVSAPITLPAFSKTNADWTSLVSCVRDEFSKYNIEVTDVDPGTSKSHIEVVVSGTPDLLGKGSNVGGTSPVSNDCSTIENSIAFAFEKVYSSMSSLCVTVAHEAGHSIGLDHEYLCKDPMTYLGGCGFKTWQDANARCGEDAARDCRCTNPFTGSKADQNTLQFLNSRLGAAPVGGGGGDPPTDAGVPDSGGGGGDTTPPSVAISSPADGATLTANTTITVAATASDNVGVTRAELQWLYNGKVFPCTAPTCTQSGNNYSWRINVGIGDRTFRVKATDAAANTSTTPDRTIHLR